MKMSKCTRTKELQLKLKELEDNSNNYSKEYLIGQLENLKEEAINNLLSNNKCKERRSVVLNISSFIKNIELQLN